MSLGKAFEFAASHHQGQLWKDGTSPFLGHPLAVAALVLKCGGDDAQVTAALVHDAACGLTGRQLEERFGAEVAALVMAFEDPPLPAGADTGWAASKRAYLEKIASLDERAALVVACEEWHELRDLVGDLQFRGETAWRRFPVIPMDVCWYYRELLKRLYHRLDREKQSLLLGEMAALVRVLVEKTHGDR